MYCTATFLRTFTLRLLLTWPLKERGEARDRYILLRCRVYRSIHNMRERDSKKIYYVQGCCVLSLIRGDG